MWGTDGGLRLLLPSISWWGERQGAPDLRQYSGNRINELPRGLVQAVYCELLSPSEAPWATQLGLAAVCVCRKVPETLPLGFSRPLCLP